MGDAAQDRVAAHFGELDVEARRLGRRLGPHLRNAVSHEELVSWGSFGLWEAAQRYDPERGIPFEHYARHRVRGAMFDGLRESHETPQRLWRARVARPEEQGASRVLDLHAERVEGARSAGWLSESGSDEWGDPVALARGPDPEAVASDRQMTDVIEAALETLPDNEAVLIREHVLDDEPLAEVAARLGLSVPRASQLRARAFRRLAARLRGLAQPDGVDLQPNA